MIKIILGDDKNITLKIEDSNGDAYDLSNADGMEAYFKNADGTCLTVTQLSGAITIIDSKPQNGKVNIRLEEAQTLLLKKGTGLDIEFLLDEAGEKRYFQFLKELEVIARIC